MSPPSLSMGRPKSSGLQVQRVDEAEKLTVGWNYEQDPESQPDSVARQGVDVAYAISPEERVNVRLGKNEKFLGVEHRKKF